MQQSSHYVTDWLDKRAKLTPERIAIEDKITGRNWSYRSLNSTVNRLANYLLDIGINPGDRVSVYASNCIEYLHLLFACGKTAAILHNLNWRLTVYELEGIVADAEPSAFFYSGDWCEQVEQLRPRLPGTCTVIALDKKAKQTDRSFSECESFAETLDQKPDLNATDAWGIYYTGGTTGLPKGAIMTHANMTWNSINTIVSWGVTAEDSAPLQLPLFHIGGPNIFMLPLVHVGGTTHLCQGFDIEQTFDLIEAGGITHYVGVPTMFIMLQQHARWASTDFSKMKLVISGGASCPLPVMQKFWDKGVDFKMGYGLTEAAGNNFWLPPEDVRRKIGSVGFPIFHIDMKIINDDGKVCGAEEEGELLIRGEHVTPGYWRRPEETAATMKNGWLHTGDIARRDRDGYFYIIGRSKEMFISGGENVYPAEVESAMHAHPAVAEAALIGIPHEKWGEVGKAFVAVEPKQSLTADELRTFLQQRLARYKVPQDIVFLEELPKTAIGKIDKKKLSGETDD